MSTAKTAQSAPDSITREERHFRRIDMRGYRRSDGLFEVVGHLTDEKCSDFEALPGVLFTPGKPMHDMGVRLVFDKELVVRDVETFTHAAPFAPCPRGGEALRAMIGVRIGAGWSAEIRNRLPKAESCTHLRELLVPMATTAIQSTFETRRTAPEPLDADGRPRRIDSCYAYAANREVVLERWPQFHKTSAGE
jgi:hypothetical protein